ncbi:GNAT family N-acetyltransferase [Methylobacterium sp. NEAU K]|uniref:GNAT family N-acetyltransferase n=1 Tax=Methylobacterium sp. NEAU K TaxID=3064946 RepID=UPI00273403FD|nr:GNAT family N-acetyltransferase [Methylobacterium sp. NEAU K]MDP4003611.1 GNAT family N-acetyltransferase [Methylobacterium sp. NEAU K]
MAVRHLAVSAHAVRRLWPADRTAVLDYFLRLDPETRANRFMGHVSEAGVRAYAAQALNAEGVMYGAFVAGTLRGLGELRPMGPGASSYVLGPRAEAAFAVERTFRRQGIGAALFARIARAARHRGVVDLHVRCLSGNGPMLRLAAKHGAELQHAGSETEGALHLDRPTPFSLWHESIAEAFDFTLAVSFPSRERASA